MTDDKNPSDGHDHNADIDPGDPVDELAELTTLPSRSFMERMWSKIERRELSVDIIDFSRSSVVQAFVEYWNMILSFFKPDQQDPGGK